MATNTILFSLLHGRVYTHLFLFLYSVIDIKLMGRGTEVIIFHFVLDILCSKAINDLKVFTVKEIHINLY